jgi:hypothetical protein
LLLSCQDDWTPRDVQTSKRTRARFAASHPELNPVRTSGGSRAAESLRTELLGAEHVGIEAASRSRVANDAVVDGSQGRSALAIGPVFSATHIQIFYHATLTIASQMAIKGDGSSMIKVLLDNALTALYVLDQMLALSALHYSTSAGASTQLFSHGPLSCEPVRSAGSTKHKVGRAQM